MSNYKDAIFMMDVYIDPLLIGDDLFFTEFNKYDDDYDGECDALREVFRILLYEDLIKVYWTADDKFYLEDATG